VQVDGYVRVSRVAGRGGERFISPKDQRARSAAWAKANGHTIAAWHEDLDQPGTRAERPGLQAAIERIEKAKTGGIVVARLDRFGRSVSDAARLIERIRNAGGNLFTVAEGIDTSSGYMGEFLVHLFAAMGQMEVARFTENWRTARANAVERGIHISGYPPAGYIRDQDTSLLAPDPTIAPAIADSFRARAAGASWKQVADELTDRGILTPFGAPRWTIATVRTVIRNRVYLGEARAGDLVKVGAHKPLIDAETWQAANRRRGNAPAASGNASGLLSGILRCAGCSFALKPKIGRSRHGKPRREYSCRPDKAAGRCPTPVSVSAEPVEDVVVARFFDELGELRALARESTDEMEAVEEALEQARSELKAMLDERLVEAMGGEKADLYVSAVRERREEVEHAEAKLAELDGGRDDLPEPTTLRRAWSRLDLLERRALLGAAYDGIFLRPATSPKEPPGERLRFFGPGKAPPLPVRGQRSVIRSVEFD